jgi:hypothetical protein
MLALNWVIPLCFRPELLHVSKDLFAQGRPSHPHQGLEMKRKHFRENRNDHAQRILNFLQRGGSDSLYLNPLPG